MSKTTFVIDRSKWRCGKYGVHRHGSGDTRLLNNEGFMCCLGHITQQLGGRDDDMLSYGLPVYTPIHMALSPILTLFTGAGWCCTEFTHRALIINDNPALTRIQRERELERCAERYGLRIEFVGRYTDEE